MTRKIELWAEIQEVNDQGEYAPVEVKPQPEVPSAGVFQLRQVWCMSCDWPAIFL